MSYAQYGIGTMSETYVHGYDPRENERLQDQAGTLVDLLHFDTSYPSGSVVLEVGCGVGAQTITLAQRSPDARFTSIDVSADSLAEAKRKADAAGLTNVQFQQADIFCLPFAPEFFDHVFVCFVLEHLSRPVEALGHHETRVLYQAVGFFFHLVLSLAVWGLALLAITLFHPEFVPPLVTLVVSLVVPLVAGFVIVKIHPSESATLPWMMGLIWWMLCGLHVLDMPTGPMACYHCGATDKLWLTFLSLNADSGLLDGQGRFIATWPAVAMIGYSLGARLGLRNADIPFENN